MRVGVLDVGSNTAHLVIAELLPIGAPRPVQSAKTRLRLAEQVGPGGALGAAAINQLACAVAGALAQADRCAVEELFGYATAVVRDAPNRDDILGAVQHRSGVRLSVLSGREEAELTFLAARRWMGSRAGPLLLFDIGGGSLELAYGTENVPEFAVSLPLGAARLTRERLAGDPPDRAALKDLRGYIREQIATVAEEIPDRPDRTVVATSRTFQQLARLCGAAPQRQGPLVPRHLHRRRLNRRLGQLSGLTAAERARLPGISAPRARQSLAGALVAHAVMKRLGVDRLMICPWALREGILLRRAESAAAWQGHCIQPERYRPARLIPSQRVGRSVR